MQACRGASKRMVLRVNVIRYHRITQNDDIVMPRRRFAPNRWTSTSLLCPAIVRTLDWTSLALGKSPKSSFSPHFPFFVSWPPFVPLSTIWWRQRGDASEP